MLAIIKIIDGTKSGSKFYSWIMFLVVYSINRGVKETWDNDYMTVRDDMIERKVFTIASEEQSKIGKKCTNVTLKQEKRSGEKRGCIARVSPSHGVLHLHMSAHLVNLTAFTAAR